MTELPTGYVFRLGEVFYSQTMGALVVHAGDKKVTVMLGKRQEQIIREHLATWFAEDESDD